MLIGTLTKIWPRIKLVYSVKFFVEFFASLKSEVSVNVGSVEVAGSSYLAPSWTSKQKKAVQP